MTLSRRTGRWSLAVLTCLSLVALVVRLAVQPRNRTAPHRHNLERTIDPETSCGPVSLAVASEYLGRPATIAWFHRSTQAGDLGVCSVSDLLRASREHGLAATAVRFDPRHPPTHRLPMILFVDGFHFLTALPAPVAGVIIIDPPATPKAMPWSSLAERWNGEAVVIGHDEAEVRLAVGGG